jgi:hypothetical protein
MPQGRLISTRLGWLASPFIGGAPSAETSGFANRRTREPDPSEGIDYAGDIGKVDTFLAHTSKLGIATNVGAGAHDVRRLICFKRGILISECVHDRGNVSEVNGMNRIIVGVAPLGRAGSGGCGQGESTSKIAHGINVVQTRGPKFSCVYLHGAP